MADFVDLTGKEINNWIVIGRADDYISPKGYHRTRWNCQCRCGTVRTIDASKLIRGSTESCGCLRRKRLERNLIGERFGELVVIAKADDWVSSDNMKRMSQWLCRCECGKLITPTENRLLSGRVKSCGHPKNLTGKRFGRLVVLSRAGDLIEKNGRHRTMWRCHCDCGNEITVTAHALHSGNTRSCGCLKKEMYENNAVDLTGVKQRQGYLIGIVRMEPRYTSGGAKISRWACLCDRCGNKIVVSTQNFLAETTRSCGCIRRSFGEAIVSDYLMEKHVDFETEYTFNDLTGIGGGKLRYDFAVFNSQQNLMLLIEFQGKQHYKATWAGHGDSAEDRFERQQTHDSLKREYAENVLHVPLIEIPYMMDKDEVYKLLNQELNYDSTESSRYSYPNQSGRL